MSSIPIFKLLRTKHWVKNILIFIPFLLGGVYELDYFYQLLLGFVSFSLFASAGYIFNDIRDVDKDRLHLTKKNRPIASARISAKVALMLGIFLFFAASLLAACIGIKVLIVLMIYFFFNTVYSIFLKSVRFIDILMLSMFYIIRLIFGAEISETPLTGWFMATMTLVFITLSASKRFMEIKLTKTDKLPGRGYYKEDAGYFWPIIVAFGLGSIILLNIHSFLVLKIQSPYFYSILNLLLAGMLFMYFDYRNDKSDDPVERILNNKPLLFLLLILLITYCREIILK